MSTSARLSRKSHPTALVLAIIAALLTATGVLAAAAGSLDPTFGMNGVTITDLGSDSDSGDALALQTDGKIILAGSAQTDAQNPFHRTPMILRYNSNGAADTSFGTNGRIVTQAGAFSGSRIAIQPDGKLVVAGSMHGDFAVARYNKGGSLDTAFGTNGIASFHFSDDESDRCTDVAIQADGGIILAGYEEIGNFVYFMVERFDSDGTPDVDFNRRGREVVWAFTNNRYNYGMAVVIQGDGKIVMSGHMQDNDGIGPRITLARFNTDGSLDLTFGVGGAVKTDFANFQNNRGALALQTDGKILVAGTSFPVGGITHVTDDLGVARFNSNGSLDTTFGGTGIVITDFGKDEDGYDVAIQPDGRIIAAGKSYDSGLADFLLVRYNSNGSLDTSFGANGKVISDFGGSAESGNGVVLQPDGKILVGGSSNGNVALARYNWTTSNVNPVTVTFRSLAAYDGWILESAENSNMGGSLDRLSTTFNLGDNAKDRQYRSLLSFNTGSLPDTAVITSAQLKIKRQGLVGTDPFATHGPLLLQIRRGTFSNYVSLQLNDFSAAASPGSIKDQVSALTFSWYQSALSTTNLGFINKYGQTQFRLLFTRDDNDDMSADYMKFFSGNSDMANRPQLIITYYVP